MFEDLVITITAPEPGVGDNVILCYDSTTESSVFRLTTVEDQVTQINAALERGQLSLESIKTFGSILFDALLGGKLLRIYERAINFASTRGNKLRLRLNSEVPALIAIPWEYLYDRRMECWLALHPDRSLVRSLPVLGRKLTPIAEKLRMLVIVSNPTDLPQLDTATEWANIENVADTAAIELMRIEPTYAALLSALRQRQPHIFHFVGHGHFDTVTQQSVLYLQKEDGQADSCTTDRLAFLLAGCENLRLALFNTCQGATPGNYSVFTGLAQKLIQQGLPAVIAMQAALQDSDALAFSQEFYCALVDGYSLEAAVSEGRKRIAEHSIAWGVPVLYIQGNELFAIPMLTNTQKAEHLWQRLPGMNERERRQQRLTQILTLDPNHSRAQAALTDLNQDVEAAQIYTAAVAYMKKEQWRDAQRTLEQVQKLVPNFRDTLSRLSEVVGKLPATLPLASTDEVAQVAAYRPILNALQEGRLTIFLGGELGHVGRPQGDRWVAGLYPPGADDAARELASYLPPELQGAASLLQVSQYTQLLDGDYALYDRLSKLYDGNFAPTMLHHLLASLPMRLAAKGYPKGAKWRYVLFSSALDDLLERAFADAGQPYHLFAYRPRFVDDHGVNQIECFLHVPPTVDNSTVSDSIEVLEPNRYAGHDDDNYPIIVKLCGRRVTTEPDSVAITEDHYMNYVSAEKSLAILPTTLLNQIKRNNFLFFGHSLHPWHHRLLWQRLRIPGGDRQLKWAIVPAMTCIEEKFWQSQRIEPIVAQPEGVVAYVNDWLATLN